jgi:hypothetical protein
MPYPSAHNYLTAHWIPVGGVGEVGQIGLRFDGAAVSPTFDLSPIAGSMNTSWWSNASVNLQPNYNLSFLRLARIGTDGLYVPGAPILDYTYSPSPLSGGTGGIQFPLQCATVVSLETGLTHGLAHSGRFYEPPLAGLLSSSQQWSTTMVNASATQTAAMLTFLNGTGMGRLSVFSKGNAAIPGGAVHAVTALHVDCRPDVQRRRAAQVTPILTADHAITA